MMNSILRLLIGFGMRLAFMSLGREPAQLLPPRRENFVADLSFQSTT